MKCCRLLLSSAPASICTVSTKVSLNPYSMRLTAVRVAGLFTVTKPGLGGIKASLPSSFSKPIWKERRSLRKQSLSCSSWRCDTSLSQRSAIHSRHLRPNASYPNSSVWRRAPRLVTLTYQSLSLSQHHLLVSSFHKRRFKRARWPSRASRTKLHLYCSASCSASFSSMIAPSLIF